MLALVTTALFGAGLLVPPVSAQYFGQNKVLYKSFDYRVLKTAHFTIYYYPEEAQAVDLAARLAERWYTRHAQILQHQLRGTQPLIMYASHPDFESTNIIPGELGEATGGVTEPLRRRIVMPMGGPLAETDHVIGHELVHAFQFDITTGPKRNGNAIGAERLPLWFIEGMAEYLSLGPIDPNTTMWIRDAVRTNKLPSVDDLTDPTYFPYRWGQALWAYIDGRWGSASIGNLLREAGKTGDVNQAITRVLGVTVKQLSSDWQAALRASAEAVLERTTPSAQTGRNIFGGDSADHVNVSPALSPDGKRVVFFSSRGLFSIDMYLADVASGRVIRKLAETALDPHLNSLEFITSVGAWAPDGRRFAFAAVRDGYPELVVIDVDANRTDREIPIREAGEIVSPTWSPDGRAIAFSAMVGGLTDLFVYDLQTNQSRRLTNDAYADLQPAWSPDGARVVFVTDRFTTDLGSLRTGPYELATVTLSSGEITRLGGLPGAKNIAPQWADRNTLYFVSDAGGISNIYRWDVAGGSPVAVTNLQTGVSGITALSPAISVDAQGRLAFCVYENNGYDLYLGELGDAASQAASAGGPAAVLPPLDRRDDAVLAGLRNATAGLPPPSVQFPVTPYRAHLTLEGAAQPYVAAGVDTLGTYAGGGVSLLFTDMLNLYALTTGVQINTGLSGQFKDIYKDTAGLVAFQNLRHRWSWGAEAEQVPYTTGSFASGLADVGGTTAFVQQTTVFRQTNRGVAGITSYPFNRAQRLELSGGYRRVSFEQELRTQVFSLDTGQLLADQTSTVPVANSLNLGQASAALIYDTAVFGATAPMLGQRYRVEVTPTLGSLTFQGVLADYRRYVMPVRFYTIAARVLHYGRYGRDGEDSRLAPLFLGYPNLVRGYDFNSFDANECHPTATSQCPALDRLLGSRMLVGSLELRFPLLRPFTHSENPYGPVPVDAALFVDGGAAWTRQTTPTFFGGSAQPVSSAGAALRVNAFGYAVLQFALVRPFQRPDKGWMFQFSFSPGF